MMAALSANFSLPAKPPAQKIGVEGWDAKVLFGHDDAPALPPAPTVEQLLARPFAPDMLRFYLTKRQAHPLGFAVEGRHVWGYKLHGEQREVTLPLPEDAPDVEQAAVAAIGAVEGTDDAGTRLAIAQVTNANWSDFIREVAEAQQTRPQPAIPAFLQSLLAQTPTVQQGNTGKSEEPTPATNAGDGAIPSCNCAGACGKEGAPALVVERECEDSQAGERNKADFFLREAGGLLKTRGKEYDRVTGAADDPPQEERSFARVAAAFNAVHDTALTPAQVCHMLALLKQVRLFTAPGFHRDSAADGVAYMALLAEEKSMEA